MFQKKSHCGFLMPCIIGLKPSRLIVCAHLLCQIKLMFDFLVKSCHTLKKWLQNLPLFFFGIAGVGNFSQHLPLTFQLCFHILYSPNPTESQVKQVSRPKKLGVVELCTFLCKSIDIVPVFHLC